ncbi:signal peptide peptidase SppA [Nitratireductor sp. CAU 1489]|uniref:Signal peptide peptidase SppA n=1 Tax=Nitratireductor arenosus TaxID=2682096 RepID=A0A844QCC4_9HYPH|nr:signal peptide peptidase SppA [Nitratireductor arenosus]MVA96892.1 signal peptide peptidase SppA [Nitratireductor arenosus]
MALRADDLIDRRRLRRKLTFWRVVALVVAALAIAAYGFRLFGDSLPGSGSDQIAKVRIEGTITEDEELLDRLERIAETDRVKGVILAIDSPGGTTAGGEAIFEAVRRLAEKKPVVAQVGTLAASAGYMIASASDHIVARKSSIVGSIGVLVQFPDLTGLMDKVGIKLEEIKSSPLKAEPSPFNPTTEEERAMIRAMILDSYDWFVGLVTERRPLSRAETERLADGSVFTGRQALERKLVDALGGEEAALAWLKSNGVDTELDVIEWKPKRTTSPYLLIKSLVGGAEDGLGLGKGGTALLRALGAERLLLDGLVSLWQPAEGAAGEQ